MKGLIKCISSFLGALILYGCNANFNMKRIDNESDLVIFYGKKSTYRMDIGLFSFSEREFSKFDLNNESLADELITTFYESDYQFKNINRQEVLFSSNWKLETYLNKESGSQFPDQFFDFLPSSVVSFP
jgi:hypothetical protein